MGGQGESVRLGEFRGKIGFFEECMCIGVSWDPSIGIAVACIGTGKMCIVDSTIIHFLKVYLDVPLAPR